MRLDRIEIAVLLARAACNDTLTEEEALVVKDTIFKLTKATARRQFSTRLIVSVHYNLWDAVVSLLLKHNTTQFVPNDNHEIDITFTYDRGLVVTVRGNTFIHSALLKSNNVATDIEQVTYNYVDAMRLMLQGKAIKNQSLSSPDDIRFIEWITPTNELMTRVHGMIRQVNIGAFTVSTFDSGKSLFWSPTGDDFSSEEWVVVK